MFKIHQFSAALFAMTAVALAPAAAYAATAGDAPAAQTLNTSPLWEDSASYIACNVVNVTTSTINVQVELISSSGSVLLGNSTPISLVAGTSTEVANLSNTFVGFARCRFITNNSPDGIRANATVFHFLGSGTYQTYATSEAR